MTSASARVPAADRHFEDYAPGFSETLGPIAMTEAAIVEFAQHYDPQPIHTNPEGAAAGPFGGLIASGWHTACAVMRVLVDGYLAGSASLASPGIDELRWLKPVRPGDRLHVRVTVVDANRSRSKPDRGLVRTSIEAINQRHEVVMSMTAMNLIRCRVAEPDAGGGKR